ncbi:MAG: hypothetical protein KAS32_31215 [Candidatus Peribacteraceae bacterium]|nr:hypothetical protein [Candidatus Peribacteraceae bacterium]
MTAIQVHGKPVYEVVYYWKLAKEVYDDFVADPAVITEFDESIIGEYLTVVDGRKYPEKGKRFNEYYLQEYHNKCNPWGGETFKVGSVDDGYMYSETAGTSFTAFALRRASQSEIKECIKRSGEYHIKMEGRETKNEMFRVFIDRVCGFSHEISPQKPTLSGKYFVKSTDGEWAVLTWNAEFRYFFCLDADNESLIPKTNTVLSSSIDCWMSYDCKRWAKLPKI